MAGGQEMRFFLSNSFLAAAEVTDELLDLSSLWQKWASAGSCNNRDTEEKCLEGKYPFGKGEQQMSSSDDVSEAWCSKKLSTSWAAQPSLLHLCFWGVGEDPEGAAHWTWVPVLCFQHRDECIDVSAWFSRNGSGSLFCAAEKRLWGEWGDSSLLNVGNSFIIT